MAAARFGSPKRPRTGSLWLFGGFRLTGEADAPSKSITQTLHGTAINADQLGWFGGQFMHIFQSHGSCLVKFQNWFALPNSSERFNWFKRMTFGLTTCHDCQTGAGQPRDRSLATRETLSQSVQACATGLPGVLQPIGGACHRHLRQA